MLHDALSQILDVLRLRSSVYFHTHFNPPWGVRVPAYGNVARFHMAMREDCWLRVEGTDGAIHMSTGDLLVIPHGASHILSDTKDREAIEVQDVISQSGYAGAGALTFGGDDSDHTCKLFCGHFEFDDDTLHPILSALPNYIHVPNTQTMNAYWLESIMRFVSSEIMGDQAGSNAIVLRLTEIIFIQVIRAFVDNIGDAAGCLAGITNPQLGKCLSKIHIEPQKPWTVEAMATEAGMSRSNFAERFTSLMGMTPLAYVTQWRMQLARRLLIDTEHRLIEIAEKTGYASEAAFNRAFKRHFDSTPGEVRRSTT